LFDIEKYLQRPVNEFLTITDFLVARKVRLIIRKAIDATLFE